MLINTLTTETGSQVLLVDQVFSKDRLNQLHAMCAEFSPGCEHWPQPDWCKPSGNLAGLNIPRYMFDNNGDEWAELVQFFSGDEFKQPFEQHLGIDLEYSTATLWADMKGFGTLGPHKEEGGGYMMQVYLTNTPHDYSGTTIYNEAGQVLVQMPYRDNFAWFFNGMQVMHGRHHDVPEGITRFTLQIWYYQSLQNKNKL
jgi:hypothetical protein